jgi:hypothetical protein
METETEVKEIMAEMKDALKITPDERVQLLDLVQAVAEKERTKNQSKGERQ